jgi:hypothetical protein
VVTGAKVYHNQPNIYRLTSEQIADLERRMTARAEKLRAAEAPEEGRQAAAAGDASSRPRNLKRA